MVSRTAAEISSAAQMIGSPSLCRMEARLGSSAGAGENLEIDVQGQPVGVTPVIGIGNVGIGEGVHAV